MVKKQFLEAGQIVNTHGVHGEMRLRPWCDSADFVMSIPRFYINGQAVKPTTMRPHKEFVLITLPGVANINDALSYKNTIVYFDRTDVDLPDGTYYIDDLVGLSVFDTRTNREIGRIADVIKLPGNDVYVVRDGQHDVMIPVVPQFIGAIDWDNNCITVTTIEGMLADEN